jgi:hypothetical protein
MVDFKHEIQFVMPGGGKSIKTYINKLPFSFEECQTRLMESIKKGMMQITQTVILRDTGENVPNSIAISKPRRSKTRKLKRGE